MNDLRLPGLHSTGLNKPGSSADRLDLAPAPARAAAADDSGAFERALKRSAERQAPAAEGRAPRGTEPGPGRASDASPLAQRTLDAMRERSRSAERVQAARLEQRRAIEGEGEQPAPSPAATPAARPDARAASADHRTERGTERGGPRHDNAASAPAQATEDNAVAQAARPAVGSASFATDAGSAVPLAIGTYAEVTHSLVAAAAAGSVSAQQAQVAMSADAVATDEGRAAAHATAADTDPALAASGTAAGASSAGKADAQDASDGASVRGASKALEAALTAETSGEAARAPARDRLLEDFERRFESSLARAAGVSSGSPLNPAGPLAAAGLPAQAAPGAASMTVAYAGVAVPIGHPTFGNDLSHRVLMFVGQRVQSAEISVTPGELGPIRVTIDVRGQEAAMQFCASHATTRAAIEDALPRLREMLAAQGLQLTQADVGDHAPRDAGGSLGGQGGREGNGTRDGNGNPARSAAGALDGTHGAPATVRRLGLIDIRV